MSWQGLRRTALIGGVAALMTAACGQAPATVGPATVAPTATSPATQAPVTSVLAPSQAAAAADWPMLRGDAARRAEGGKGPVGMPVLRWRFQTSGSINGSLAVVAGIVYAISDEGTLHALNADTGKQLWTFAGAQSPDVGPAVWSGSVYVTDAQGIVRAVDATSGKERWHSASAIRGGLAVADGGVYVSSNGAIVALDAATGAERWRYSAPTAGLFHNPAVAGGVVYAGSDTGGYVAVDAATGALRWHADTGADQPGTAVVADGVAYLGDSGDGKAHLYAFDAATGSPTWRIDQAVFSPAVSGGIGYSGSNVGHVSAHELATGRELWRFPIKGEAQPVAVAAGVVYVPASGESRVYALDAAHGAELWHFDVDSSMVSMAVSAGSVYVGTSLGSVYDRRQRGGRIARAGPVGRRQRHSVLGGGQRFDPSIQRQSGGRWPRAGSVPLGGDRGRGWPGLSEFDGARSGGSALDRRHRQQPVCNLQSGWVIRGVLGDEGRRRGAV
jgi:outer membrane protein assembly factor BamB